MKEVLTIEEKDFLRRMCNYLRSFGMEEGVLDFEIDNYSEIPDERDIFSRLENATTFSNNYSVEIPERLIPIFTKIFKWCFDNNKFVYPNAEGISYAKVELTIDCDDHDIRINQMWFYYEPEDESSLYYSPDEDPDYADDLNEIFSQLNDLGYFSDNNKELTLNYEGGGDSGYLSDNFEGGDFSVPNSASDWCYDRLESQFGGWEINEGSQGRFIFDSSNNSITLEHAYNVEESESITAFENNFGK